MEEALIVEVEVAAPAETVWAALRDPQQLRRWHGWEYDQLDEEIRMIYLDDVVESEPDWSLDTGAGRFALEPRGEQTVVRVFRAPPEGATSWEGVEDAVNDGWTTFAQQLRFYLERHPGQRRGTRVAERELTLPDGEEWFETGGQRGVLADEDTLVVVGAGRTVVSGYGDGADDDALDALMVLLGG